jgi:hypothetical protein
MAHGAGLLGRFLIHLPIMGLMAGNALHSDRVDMQVMFTDFLDSAVTAEAV